MFISAARDALVYNLPGPYASSLLDCAVGGLLALGVSLWVYFKAETKVRKDGVIDRRLA